MKIALVHDYIKEYGGAERVLEALHEIWPEAPVYTTVYLPDFLGPHKERFKGWDIRTSFLQNIPLKEKLISPFRIIAPFMFKIFDLSNFDVVIVSATGAYFPDMVETKKNIVIARSEERATRQSYTEQGIASPLRGLAMTKRKWAIHICYCHTPPRYLYGFATAREWKKNLIFKVIGGIANHFLRLVDFKSSQNVDYFIANSQNVRERIKKFYRRDSVVVYPPVDVDSSMYHVSGSKYKKHTKYILHNTSYFLAGGRLARPKHIDLIVRACRELGVPLKVFGKGFGGWGEEIDTQSRHSGKPKVHPESPIVQSDSGQARMTSSNIEFLGEIRDEEKLELMRNAKAYIFASEDEDFGITPVEAMMCGTPVIAYKSGGVVESVIQGKTGLFFDELTIESLIAAIKQFNNLTINSADCINQAEKFSKERFKREIKEFVEKYV
ncbi:MAG: glycosyltransferase [Patescibacteria group bacterium]